MRRQGSMLGGGVRKDDRLLAKSRSNIFSALESCRRKSSKKSVGKDTQLNKSESGDAAQFWAPAAVAMKSWADVEDDDDYYATAAPPPAWGSVKKAVDDAPLQKQESSDGEDSEVDEEFEEELEDVDETEVQSIDAKSMQSVSQSQIGCSSPTIHETNRQLSKKELKKKELAEFDAVLAELGLPKQNEDVSGIAAEKTVDINADESGEGEQKGASTILIESKSSKRRKSKKEKSSKQGKYDELSAYTDLECRGKVDVCGPQDEPTTTTADSKEVLKKIAMLKKKKSTKESDAAVKAAGAEASARAARLAAAKKKEKSNYNQQPARR